MTKRKQSWRNKTKKRWKSSDDQTKKKKPPQQTSANIVNDYGIFTRGPIGNKRKGHKKTNISFNHFEPTDFKSFGDLKINILDCEQSCARNAIIKVEFSLRSLKWQRESHKAKCLQFLFFYFLQFLLWKLRSYEHIAFTFLFRGLFDYDFFLFLFVEHWYYSKWSTPVSWEPKPNTNSNPEPKWYRLEISLWLFSTKANEFNNVDDLMKPSTHCTHEIFFFFFLLDSDCNRNVLIMFIQGSTLSYHHTKCTIQPSFVSYSWMKDLFLSYTLVVNALQWKRDTNVYWIYSVNWMYLMIYNI